MQAESTFDLARWPTFIPFKDFHKDYEIVCTIMWNLEMWVLDIYAFAQLDIVYISIGAVFAGGCRGAAVMEPTQIILAGFGAGVSAKQLTEYLEKELKKVRIVWRCRLKTSWTPPSSFPKFTLTGSSNGLVKNREKAPPHAFVYFEGPDDVKEAVRLSSLRKLVFNNQALKIKP
ncbi:hypothetical protein SUGI_0973930 [Cryptomeria japonica]|nr:hypothetical protein SUGI_0973930 [Cryptomeria japonica]